MRYIVIVYNVICYIVIVYNVMRYIVIVYNVIRYIVIVYNVIRYIVIVYNVIRYILLYIYTLGVCETPNYFTTPHWACVKCYDQNIPSQSLFLNRHCRCHYHHYTHPIQQEYNHLAFSLTYHDCTYTTVCHPSFLKYIYLLPKSLLL